MGVDDAPSRISPVVRRAFVSDLIPAKKTHATL
jgi:hypothetical protein